MGRLTLIIISIFLLLSCVDRKEVEESNKDFLIYKIKLAINYHDLKLIEGEAQKLEYDTLIRNNLDKISDKYYDLKKFEDYYRISNIILNKSKKINDTIGIIEGLCKKGAYYSNIYKLDSMYYYYTKAEAYSIKTKNKYQLETIFLNKAAVNQTLNDYYNLEKNSFEALKILKNKNNNYLLYNAYINIGFAAYNQNNENEAISYFKKAEKITEKIENSTEILSLKAQVYYYYCLIYDKKRFFKTSYLYAKKGLSIDDFKTKDPFIFCGLNNRLGYSKLKLNDTTAKTNFIETLEIAKKNNNLYYVCNSYIYLSEYYYKYHDTEKSFASAKKAFEIASKNNLQEDKLKSLLLLAKSSPKETTKYFESYKKTSDDIINNERQIRNKFARIEYETDEIISEKDKIQKEKT